MNPIHGNTIYVSHTSLIEPFGYCPTRAYYSSILERAPATSASLRFGDYIHQMLSLRYKHEAMGGKVDDNLTTFQQAELSKLFKANPHPREEWRDLNLASRVIQQYNKLHPAGEFKPAWLNGQPFVEKTFACEAGQVDGYQVVYIGTIDLCEETPQGFWVWDHKTTSRLGQTFWDDLSVSDQGRGYCWAFKQSTGITPIGYVINALAFREPSKNGVALEFPRQRFYTTQPEGQLEEWLSNMLATVEEFLWHYKNNKWPRHRSQHCVGKYGQCPYFNVCSLYNEAERMTVLNSTMFTRSTGSPSCVKIIPKEME